MCPALKWGRSVSRGTWYASYVSRMPQPEEPAHFEADPVIEAYKRDVDRTLLRENLKKSPDQRVRDLMRLQRLAEEARSAGRRLREH